MQIYKSILFMTRMAQNKNDSINLILQHGRVVDKTCCVVFPTLRFPLSQTVQMVAITYLAIRAKSN